MSPGTLNMTANVWRQTQTKSATSAAIAATWTRVGSIRCTLQSDRARYDPIAGAMRQSNGYTLFTSFDADLRPSDRIEFDSTDSLSGSPGVNGPDTNSPNVYTIESGPIDEAGRRSFLRFTVNRSSATSRMQNL